MNEDIRDNWLLYDGDCPFCSRYVRLTRLRNTVGELRLVNARDHTPELELAGQLGYVIDDGMLLHLEGSYFHGSDCLQRLALLSSRSDLFNRIAFHSFRSPLISRFVYPALKLGRNLIIRLLGRGPLGY